MLKLMKVFLCVKTNSGRGFDKTISMTVVTQCISEHNRDEIKSS